MAGLLDTDVEAWSRLSGLLAMLALPPVRCDDGRYQRRLIEIEIAPGSDKWTAIDGLTIEPTRLIFYTGMNGTRRQWVFVRPEGVPRWRAPNVPPSRFLADG